MCFAPAERGMVRREKMAKAATNDELREAFEEHLEQTQGHVQRLEEIFSSIGEKIPRRPKPRPPAPDRSTSAGSGSNPWMSSVRTRLSPD